MRKWSYAERLAISLDGNTNTTFYTSTELIVAKGYSRIVIGERGPYVEFSLKQLYFKNFIIPDSERYRIKNPHVYYIEWRTHDKANIKIYEQKKLVDYADYKLGMFYISPFELYVMGGPIITKLRKENAEKETKKSRTRSAIQQQQD